MMITEVAMMGMVMVMAIENASDHTLLLRVGAPTEKSMSMNSSNAPREEREVDRKQ